jgi:hypothetical protein
VINDKEHKLSQYVVADLQHFIKIFGQTDRELKISCRINPSTYGTAYSAHN